jgi:hypothetical protein
VDSSGFNGSPFQFRRSVGDADWAGVGYTRVPEPTELEPAEACDQPA